MPPKVKIKKEDIINTALALVREGGANALNVRAIAAALGCSTQPIFSNFTSMEVLQNEVVAAAFACYFSFLEKEASSGQYPPYKAYGMAYIRFAKEEKELFKLLFMRDRTGEIDMPTPDVEQSVQMIMAANNLSEEKAKLMHLEMWSVVHGIGVMLATSYLPLDWSLVSDILSDVYQGLRQRHGEVKV